MRVPANPLPIRYAVSQLHLPNHALALVAAGSGMGAGAAGAAPAGALALLGQPAAANRCLGRAGARPEWSAAGPPGWRGHHRVLARRLRLGGALAARPRR